ncbi:WLM domain-containing protein [Podospora didyma]|uniref:WLM domain-containing protein n=1 Tax=Podospora didyma TaxID=330526 RepID=A0AAE0U8T2_9PEZI|nr:WLM domain-containing protein [Podospora didyma]
MPIGIQRINEKKSQPNDRIVFIKPLKGPDEAIAQDFLERIAAQCLPIMRENHLSVMSLEEYEPNAEFVGRNFNAGEVIQLVLKARFTSHWLPFNYTTRLAHCKQMNHSKAFWAVRNQYAEQMRGLWLRKFTGEGLWGRGALLATGQWETNSVQPGEMLPEYLCGGTYRSRGRKRKAKKVLTYQEQKERRILKKFGANGVVLGDDAETKRKLEKGRTIAAKPRVAASARGRELRAAAALARFDQQKEEPDGEKRIKGEDDDEESGSGEDDYEDEELNSGQLDALDLDGKRMLDAKGRGMVKVCEDENLEDQDAKQELLELQNFSSQRSEPASRSKPPATSKGLKSEPSSLLHPDAPPRAPRQDQSVPREFKTIKSEPSTQSELTAPPLRTTQQAALKLPKREDHQPQEPKEPIPSSCPVCSFANDQLSATCAMCANVLYPGRIPDSWACNSRACQGTKYRNAGDCGVCGLCGGRRGV